MEQREVKKSVLVIKANPTSLGSVEGFLRNREWKIKSTTNLKEALIYLVQEQPLFVMISVDHPNKKVQNLPRILKQAFPVCVITFAEESSATSFKQLSNSGSEYMIYPPVTGPAVERTVNKYYKDLQTKSSAAHREHLEGKIDEDSGVIAIRGSSQNFSGQNAQNILAQLLSEDHGANNFGSVTTSGADISGVVSGPKMGPAGMAAHGIGAGTLHSSTLDPQSGSSPMRARQRGGQGDMGSWIPLPETIDRKERLTPEQIERDPRATKADSIILRGTKEALDKSCVKSPFKEAQTIDHATNVACIVIESSRFSGYLIAALGKDKSIDDKFIGKIQERLVRFLKDNGESISESEAMNINIKQVPFEDWALEYAEFLRKSVHEGNEVAMAFFPRAEIKAKAGDSVAEEMTTIQMEELVGNVAVEFNLYVYLPKNNKFILYTPRGGVFYDVQKDRLKGQGISQLHIFKSELKDLDKYRAQNFLNEKINAYEDKRRTEEIA